MQRSRWTAAAATVAASLVPAGAAQAAETIYGVTATDKLVSFSSDSPGSVAAGRAIAGLGTGETVVGIDVRPRTGDLTAVTSSGRILLIDARTAQAAPLPGAPQLALAGARFGVDFNPQADALRIVSDTGQNLRVTLGGSGVVNTDGALNPAGAAVVAAGYTRSFDGTATTTLLDIDSATDTLRVQNPPNAGTLADVGPLGVNVSADAAFDIAPSDGAGHLAARLEGEQATKLFRVDTATGAATLTGPVAGEPLRAIAIARQAATVYVSDDLDQLTTLREGSARTVTPDVPGGEELIGLDTRPATGELYGLGDAGNLYVVDPRTGRSVLRSPAPLALAGSAFGFDFNPVPDALRIVSDAEQNLRATGAGAGAVVVDSPLTPDSDVAGAAYLNPFAGTTVTALFDVDPVDDQLLLQNPPNNGVLTPVGPLGVDAGTVGFDIAAQDNAALLGTNGRLHRVDLATGTAQIGPQLPAGVGAVNGLAVAGAGAVGLAATALGAEEGQPVAVTVAREGGEGTATVNYAVEGGESGAVTFQPGETLETFSVANPEDTVAEPAQTVRITLARAAGGYRLGATEATLTIADDDAAAPAPDRVKPALLVIANDLKLRTLRRSGIRVAFSCSEACTVRARVQLKRRTVGTARASLAGPGVGSVRVRLSRSGARRVGKGKSRALRLVLDGVDAAGNTARKTDRFTARR